MTIRAATRDDLPTLFRLTRAFYDEDGFATSDAGLRRNLETVLSLPTAHVVVVEGRAELIAFALTTTAFILESGVVAELQDLYVAPQHRRRGIAAALIDDAARWAQDQSATLLEIVVAPNGRDVSSLVGYYTARGFRDEGRKILMRAL